MLFACRHRMQGHFDFDSSERADGYAKWLVGRQVAIQELAHRIHLPLAHEVEVWLRGGIRLRGKLRLEEEILLIEEEQIHHLRLLVDKVSFTYGEMESCVRLD